MLVSRTDPNKISTTRSKSQSHSTKNKNISKATQSTETLIRDIWVLDLWQRDWLKFSKKISISIWEAFSMKSMKRPKSVRMLSSHLVNPCQKKVNKRFIWFGNSWLILPTNTRLKLKEKAKNSVSKSTKTLDFQLVQSLSQCLNSFMRIMLRKTSRSHQIWETNKFREPLKTIKETRFPASHQSMHSCSYLHQDSKP